MTPAAIRQWAGNPETRTRDKALFAAAALTFFCLPLGTAPMLIAGGLAMAIWLFSGIAFESRNLYKASYWWPVYALLLLPWIGLIYTSDTTGLGNDYAEKTYYWLMGLAVAGISFRHFSAIILVQSFMLGLAVNVIAAILQIVFDLRDKNNWHLGLGPDYSTLSAYLIVGLMMGIYFLGRERDLRRRLLLLGVIALYFLHLVLLQSRASYVTLMIMTPFMGLTYFKDRKVLKTALVIVLIPCLMLLSPVVRKRVDHSIDQLQFHLNADNEAAWGKKYSRHQDRFYMWNSAVRIIRENPWIGVGTGGYKTALKAMDNDPKAPEIAHPHNNFLYMAVSFGVIGLAVFLWFLVATLRAGWRQRNSAQGYLLLSVILVMATSGLFNSQIIDVGTAFLISLCVGLQASFSATPNSAASRSRPKAG
jgi:O-antigen ligase